jgi:putative nucleotidyltransferase with HDIG domain
MRERLALVPFVVGGIAALWLVRASDGPAIAGVGWLVSALAVATGFLLLTTSPAHGRPRRSSVRRERLGSNRWEARPVGSLLVRILAVIGPIGVSLATALAVQRALPAPSSGLVVVGQAVLLMVIAFAVLYPAERATRKLAPIAMLLKLSLSFPSEAPSRFVVARRSANVREVKRDLDAGRGDLPGNMLALVAALTAHDSRTRGHSERVRVFTEMLAEELGLDADERQRLRWAALLHDIGKLSVSADILNKPARLDASEWETMYGHPEEGARLIAPMAPWLGEWAAAVVEHHERLDGSGYPRGLPAEEISLGARIIAVADAYDTMVTPRTYHRAIAASAAREEVARVSGMQFDPQVVRALLSLSIPKLWWRIGIGAWLSQLPLLSPRRSRSSAQGGVANVVGIAAIAVTSVLAPMASLPPTLPAAPGFAAEASPEEQAPEEEPSSGAGRPTRSERVEQPEDVKEVAEAAPPSASAAGVAGDQDDSPGAGGGVGSQGGGVGSQGGGGGGSAGGGGDVGAAGGGVTFGEGGTVTEANEDVVIAGSPGPPPPSSTPPPGPGSPPVVGDEGTDPPDGHGKGHDKCKGKGHKHHEHDGC